MIKIYLIFTGLFFFFTEFNAQSNSQLDKYQNAGNETVIRGDYAFVGDPNLGVINSKSTSAVIIFKKDNDEWSQLKMVQDKNASVTFGKSIAHSVNTLFICDEDRSEVLLYSQSENYRRYYSVLSPEYPKKHRDYGRSIAASDDYLFVSYVQKAQGINGARGCVDVYHHKNKLWFKVDEIRSPDNVDVEGFGTILSADNDQLVISSNKSISNNKKGSVYLYQLEGDGWSYKQQITLDNSKRMNGFGYALELKNNKLFVCESELNEFENKDEMYAFQRNNFFNGGAVYCYSNSSNSSIDYKLDTIIRSNKGNEYEGFGSAISYHKNKLFICAYQGIAKKGKVYYYELGCNNSWSLKSIIKSQNPNEEKQFGFSVYATSNEVMIGAKRANSSKSRPFPYHENIGKTYFFSYLKERDFMGQLIEERELQYRSPSGKLFYKSEEFVDTIQKTDGCDSLIHIKLTINNTDPFALDSEGNITKTFKVSPVLLSDKEINNTKFIKRLSVDKPFIKLEYFDQGTVDNDTISIKFNDNWLVLDKELTKEKNYILVQLEEGENSILFRAENVGTEYPNTSRVVVYNQDGKLISYANMKSNMDESSFLIINYTPKKD
jgi:hypothetical protein